MKDKKTESKLNWEQYHTTRELLLSAIEVHLKSIGLVNVYDSETNQSDSYSLTNESMGTTELNKLKERLTI